MSNTDTERMSQYRSKTEHFVPAIVIRRGDAAILAYIRTHTGEPTARIYGMQIWSDGSARISWTTRPLPTR